MITFHILNRENELRANSKSGPVVTRKATPEELKVFEGVKPYKKPVIDLGYYSQEYQEMRRKICPQ